MFLSEHWIDAESFDVEAWCLVDVFVLDFLPGQVSIVVEVLVGLHSDCALG